MIIGIPTRFQESVVSRRTYQNFTEDSNLPKFCHFVIMWSWPTGIVTRWLQILHRSISLHSRHLHFMPSMSLWHLSHLLNKPSWSEFLDKHNWASLSLSKSPNALFCSHVRTENVLIHDVNFLCLLKNWSYAFSSLKYQGLMELPLIEINMKRTQ